MLLYVHSSIAIILMGKRELVALLNLSSWCLVMVERLFLTVPQGCLRFVIVVFPDHTHLLFLFLTTKDSGGRFDTSKFHLSPQWHRLQSVLRRWFCCFLFIIAPSVCGVLCLVFMQYLVPFLVLSSFESGR